MKKGKIIEKTSYLISRLAVVATIATTIYGYKYSQGKTMLFLIPALIFFISYGVHENAKENNQNTNQ